MGAGASTGLAGTGTGSFNIEPPLSNDDNEISEESVRNQIKQIKPLDCSKLSKFLSDGGYGQLGQHFLRLGITGDLLFFFAHIFLNDNGKYPFEEEQPKKFQLLEEVRRCKQWLQKMVVLESRDVEVDEEVDEEEEEEEEEIEMLTRSGRPATETIEGDELKNQQGALESLYRSTNCTAWQSRQWTEGGWTDPASLSGLKLNQSGFVIEINLSKCGLQGPLTTSLGLLTSIKKLCLDNNALTGQIPAELGLCTQMEYLDLKANKLSGPIPPELGRCRSLQKLVLANNNLSGELPVELSALTSLQLANFTRNANLKGNLPSSLLRLKGLRLYTGGTGLSITSVSLDVPQFELHVVPVNFLLTMVRLMKHEEAGVRCPETMKNARSRNARWDGRLERLEPLGDTKGAIFHSWTTWSESKIVYRQDIVFISHRWLSDGHPDDKFNSKLRHLKRLLKGSKWKYVWIDYLCCPQSNQAEQAKAINSLPHYVKCCDAMITLCGNEFKATLEVYKSRGWCRLEQLSALVPIAGRTSNKENNEEFLAETRLFIANKNTNSFEVMTKLQEEYLNPLKGVFYDPNDKARVSTCLKVLCEVFIESQYSDEKLRELGMKVKVFVEQQAPAVQDGFGPPSTPRGQTTPSMRCVTADDSRDHNPRGASTAHSLRDLVPLVLEPEFKAPPVMNAFCSPREPVKSVPPLPEGQEYEDEFEQES